MLSFLRHFMPKLPIGNYTKDDSVAGKVKRYYKNQLRLKPSNCVLKTVKDRYLLPLENIPSPFKAKNNLSGLKELSFVEAEINRLLEDQKIYHAWVNNKYEKIPTSTCKSFKVAIFIIDTSNMEFRVPNEKIEALFFYISYFGFHIVQWFLSL